MTVKTAIEVLQYYVSNSEHHEATQIAISALEKQMPKKPSLHDEPYPKHKTGTKSPFCPDCDHDLLDDANDCFRYCPDCGQAIDWSDEE